jgi:hypothetical protein
MAEVYEEALAFFMGKHRECHPLEAGVCRAYGLHAARKRKGHAPKKLYSNCRYKQPINI